MKKTFTWVGTLALATVACCLEPAKQADGVTLKVTLTDDSQLLGTPLSTSLSLVTGLGKQQVPFALVSALDVTKDGVKVKFVNRDVLSGKIENPALKIVTGFGEVNLGFSQIKTVQVLKPRGALQNVNEPGLLLYAPLDAEDANLDAFEARMEVQNVQIVEGRAGNAMLLESVASRIAIDLPFSPYLMPEGTIEFWARFPQPQQPLLVGRGQPWLLNVVREGRTIDRQFLLGYVLNDGSGNGGLSMQMPGVAVGTHVFGAVSSVSETRLLGNTPDGWHHYAVIWKQDGVDFPDARGRKLILAIDGKIVASTEKAFVLSQDAGTKSRVLIYDEDSGCPHPFEISDLKIWDTAKPPAPVE